MKTAILLYLVLEVASAGSLKKRDSNWVEDRAIAAKAGFTLTWYDDFVGKSGSAPSSSNWIIDTGTQYPDGPAQWGNGESETYTSSASNVYLSAYNTLLIVPVKSSSGTWTSGRIETKRSDFVCASGGKMYIESQMRLGANSPAQQGGIWPAFWSLGAKYRTDRTTWPWVGEWDFLETVNGQAKMYSSVHCGTAPGGFCNEYNGIGNGGKTGFSRGAWHIVGFMVDRTTGSWKTDTLTWYLDGQATYQIKGATIGDQKTWEALAYGSRFLLFNVAVGGSMPDGLAGKTSLTAQTIGGLGSAMEIDYVVVYNS